LCKHPDFPKWERWEKKTERENRWILRVAVLALFMALLAVLYVDRAYGDVGCEYYNSTVIRCENEGDIEPVTFIEASRGIQMANNLTERFDWLIYDLGLWYEGAGGNPIIISFYDLPFDFLGIESDNLTYWSLSWRANFTAGQKKANFTYTLSQRADDNMVNWTATLKTGSVGWTAFNRSVHFWRSMKDINIDLDGDVDNITFMNGSEQIDQGLNNSNFYNATGAGITVYDTDTNHKVFWWREDYNHTRQITIKNNSNVWISRETYSAIKPNKTYFMIEWWIDVEDCTITCGAGASFAVYAQLGGGADTTLYVTENDFDAMECKYSVFEFFPPNTCTFADCYLMIEYNESTTNWAILSNITSTPVECFDVYCRYSMDNLAKNTWYEYNLTGLKVGENDLRCSISGNDGTSATGWTVTKTFVELWHPEDNHDMSLTNYSYFKANWTVTAPDNMSLYLNDTLNDTQVGSATNYTNNVSFESSGYGCWEWDIYSCIDHFCYWSDNGNWTTCRQELFEPQLPLNITLWAPDNNTNISLTNWSVFKANWTWLKCDNMTLRINDTDNFTQDCNTNLSRNVSFVSSGFGVWEWDVLACWEHDCNYSWNGNWTVFREPLVDVEEDDFIAIMALCGIILGGLIIIFSGKRNKNVQRQNSETGFGND